MSIENITGKILADAKVEAEEAINQAMKTAEEILAGAEKKAKQVVDEAEKSGATEKEQLITRRKAVAEIDGGKITLSAKQKLISQCFDKAIELLINMEKQEYIHFLGEIVKNTGITEGELILNDKEAASMGKELEEHLKTQLPGSKIFLSSETRQIRGGFLLKSGNVYINGTVEALVEEAKGPLTAEVAQILFQ